jgi:hypothetical protein
MKLVLAFLVFVPTLMACGACRENPVTPPDPPDPADGGAGGAPVVVLEPCERACLRLAELGCEEAQPTDDGASCVDVCRNVEDSGAVSLDPECVVQIAQCEDVDACVSMALP